MSTYTTGEIAKLVGVTVRTVQYYDTRGILIPSDFSEGGRRLYNEKDLKKLQVICFLRGLGLQINSIAEILESDNASAVIGLLLEQQRTLLENEITERKMQLETIEGMKQELKNFRDFSIENLNDIARIMENKKKHCKIHAIILVGGIVVEGIECATLVLGIFTGNWIPFVVGFIVAVILSAFLVKYYYENTVYICPECHEVFRPKFKDFFFSAHTPKTRRLSCTACGHRGFCVETYDEMGGAHV